MLWSGQWAKPEGLLRKMAEKSRLPSIDLDVEDCKKGLRRK